MKLFELIQTNNWLSVKETLLSLYPDQEEGISAYQKVFSQLLQMNSNASQMEIVMKEYYDEEAYGKSYVDVSGSMLKGTEEEMSYSYAIEFEPWENWLGMSINETSLKEFTELEIISHCLFEMTFMGYDENEIQGFKSKVEKSIDDYKLMTKEEKSKLKSIDDLLSELEDD